MVYHLIHVRDNKKRLAEEAAKQKEFRQAVERVVCEFVDHVKRDSDTPFVRETNVVTEAQKLLKQAGWPAQMRVVSDDTFSSVAQKIRLELFLNPKP